MCVYFELVFKAVAEDAFIQNGIDVGLFSFTYQGEDCIYLDEP